MKFVLRTIQLFMILTPIVLFGWLWVQNTIPSGEFLVKHSVQERSPFIDTLLTRERVTDPYRDETGTWVQKIFGDPVFFFVHPHILFSNIEATIWFQNNGAPIVELGALTAKDPERYILEPLQNLLIDQSKWHRLSDGKNILLQRQARFKSIADFYKKPPPINEIATYHADLSVPFRLSLYTASENTRSIDVSLRGAHQMKTYIKQEPLRFTFLYMDMNRDQGADPVAIFVFNEEGEPVGEVRAEDDKDVSQRGYPSGMRALELLIPNLPEGVYKLDVRANRDIFFRAIKTTQQKIIFLNGVYLADENAYRETFRPVNFFSEAKRLSFQTRHAEGVQTVMIANKPFFIESPYRLFTAFVESVGLGQVLAQKGDVEVIADAPIAFDRAQFFRPDPVRLTPHTNVDTLGINYVIARYTPPVEEVGWMKATVSFDATKFLFDKQSWKFTFSTPEILELDASVLIKKIEMKMKK